MIARQQARKQLSKIGEQHQPTILKAVRTLSTMPDCVNVKALTNHAYGYRLRVGDFRVIFDWSGEVKVVEIQEVRKRNERTY